MVISKMIDSKIILLVVECELIIHIFYVPVLHIYLGYYESLVSFLKEGPMAKLNISNSETSIRALNPY